MCNRPCTQQCSTQGAGISTSMLTEPQDQKVRLVLTTCMRDEGENLIRLSSPCAQPISLTSFPITPYAFPSISFPMHTAHFSTNHTMHPLHVHGRFTPQASPFAWSFLFEIYFWKIFPSGHPFLVRFDPFYQTVHTMLLINAVPIY